MQTYQYSCNYCNYFIETSGPWPYYKELGRRIRYESWLDACSGPIHGLMANIYCPICDRQKEYSITEYGTPLSSLPDVWLGISPRKLNADDAKVIFHPIDYIVFNGMKQGSSIKNIVLLDRQETGKLHRSLQRSVERVVEGENYEWQTLRVKEDGKINIE